MLAMPLRLLFSAVALAIASSVASLAAQEETIAAGSPATPVLDQPSLVEAPRRRCVIRQCVDEPLEPADTLFTKHVKEWTAIALIGGAVEGIRGPVHYGFDDFHVAHEGYFQPSSYVGGADKASHIVNSANLGNLLYDAYALNGLTPNRAFWLSVSVTSLAGTLVEVADGFTIYGFSGSDLMTDVLGATAAGILKRTHRDDRVGFRVGWTPTHIPRSDSDAGVRGTGTEYSQEIYTVDVDPAWVVHSRRQSRFLLLSFVFLTKGYGYSRSVPMRYQQVGFEIGANLPRILEAFGVSNRTSWGDALLRSFSVFRVPFTQVGVYFDLTRGQWYGPGAPYHFR